MEKLMKMFKHNSRLKFLDCLQKCWPPTAAHKCVTINRLINTPLRMCREIGMYPIEALPVFCW